MDRKDCNSRDFGLKQRNVNGTCFVNGIMRQKVLYIAPLGMIFFIALSYTRMSVYTKFELIWSRLASTYFTNVQLDQKCKVEASLA